MLADPPRTPIVIKGQILASIHGVFVLLATLGALGFWPTGRSFARTLDEDHHAGRLDSAQPLSFKVARLSILVFGWLACSIATWLFPTANPAISFSAFLFWAILMQVVAPIVLDRLRDAEQLDDDGTKMYVRVLLVFGVLFAVAFALAVRFEGDDVQRRAFAGVLCFFIIVCTGTFLFHQYTTFSKKKVIEEEKLTPIESKFEDNKIEDKVEISTDAVKSKDPDAVKSKDSIKHKHSAKKKAKESSDRDASPTADRANKKRKKKRATRTSPK